MLNTQQRHFKTSRADLLKSFLKEFKVLTTLEADQLGFYKT